MTTPLLRPPQPLIVSDMRPLLAHTGFQWIIFERGIWQQFYAILIKNDLLPESNLKSGALLNDQFFSVSPKPEHRKKFG